MFSGRRREKIRRYSNTNSSREKAILCAREAVGHKALDLVILEVSRFSSFADYFIICSGKFEQAGPGNRRQPGKGPKRQGESSRWAVEGKQEGHWVLLDYGDVIIHIFYEPVRDFYDLESLWSEASRVDWEHYESAPGPERD